MIAADQFRNLISKKLRGQFRSLMFDSASRNGRHVFGATLRYAKVMNIVELIMGLLSLNIQQHGETLKYEMIKMLE